MDTVAHVSLTHDLILSTSDKPHPGNPKVTTVLDALRALSKIEARGFTFYDAELNPEFWPYTQMVREIERRGRYLRSLGLERGARVALIIPEYGDFVLSFFGAISAGFIPVPLAPPIGAKERQHVEVVAGILQASGAALLILGNLQKTAVSALRSHAPSLEILPASNMRENRHILYEEFAHDYTLTPSDICFLQYTSGSTSRPKGVIVTHGNLVANAHAIFLEHFEADLNRDVTLAWLPLYHDMGLIGFVCSPLIIGLSAVVYPVLTFMWRPNSWMRLVAKHRATVTFAPNFAFRLVAKRQKEVEGLDLSSLRILGCGAEPIEADALREFAKVFGPGNLNPSAVMPAYGMAEHTLAITFESYRDPLCTLCIDRAAYERGEIRHVAADHPGAMELVSCGRPFAGHQVAIRGEHGLLPSGRVGEIVLRGPSVTPGYFGDEQATAALFWEGWMRTGDLGFVYAGRLYVSGRTKDVVIINGKNYYPQDIEWELDRVPGLRRGAIVVLGVTVEGSERIVVVAETGPTTAEAEAALRRVVTSVVTAATGISPYQIVFVPPHTVPKTSSGKLQRQKTKQRLLDGTLEDEMRQFRQAREIKRAASVGE